jgi:hypothetical protein
VEQQRGDGSFVASKARRRTAVRRLLRRRNVKADDFEPFMEKFMAQAEALYAEWPLAA